MTAMRIKHYTNAPAICTKLHVTMRNLRLHVKNLIFSESINIIYRNGSLGCTIINNFQFVLRSTERLKHLEESKHESSFQEVSHFQIIGLRVDKTTDIYLYRGCYDYVWWTYRICPNGTLCNWNKTALVFVRERVTFSI